jgi:AcrR family transcriptional regulator
LNHFAAEVLLLHMVNSYSRSELATPRLRDRFRAAAKEAILEAAERIFARDGVKGARMEAIAQAAGVAVGTLYNHFEDRGALLDALLRARQIELLGHLDEELEAHQRQSFLEQLCAFVEATLDQFAQHDAFLKVLLESEREAEGLDLWVQLRRRLELLVQRGVKSKSVRADGAQVFGWLILGVLRSMLVRQTRGEATESIEAQRAMIVRFVLQGAETRR